MLETLFWFNIFILVYSYFCYGILIFILVQIKQLFYKTDKQTNTKIYEPEVTLFVPAYNEKNYVDAKIKNTLELDYPSDKKKILWVTDGSNDGTPETLAKYNFVEVLHKPEREGKIAAMNRGMSFVKTPIVIFSDANTLLSGNSIREIVRQFKNPKVGCVAGEKRILLDNKTEAASAGEGIYWKYESFIKLMDAKLNSSIGAVGELFAIRTALYEPVEPDTILDDFMISMRIAIKGYKIQYAPNAYAIENASQNIKEEMKRKIRIAAGSFQSIPRLKVLFNPFKHGLLSFQYISHKVLRWTIAPLSMVTLVPVTFLLTFKNTGNSQNIYSFTWWLIVVFGIWAIIGWFFENKKIKYKYLFVPYYICIMNVSAFLGFFRYLKKSQSVNWERAKRKE